jgi:hypothetical protein
MAIESAIEAGFVDLDPADEPDGPTAPGGGLA